MVEPGRSAAVASQLTGRDLHGERSLGARPGGFGVLVADEVEVTWLQPPVPAPHPGAELLAYLAAHGLADMPRYFGAVEHDDTVIALVGEHVADAREAGEQLAERAAAAGDLVARLHTVLGGLQRSTIGTRTYLATADADLHHLVRDPAEEAAARAALEPLRGDRMLHAHRVHGDLHPGQFLLVGDRLLLQGFAGNPLTDGPGRRLPQSPLVDVAALLEAVVEVGGDHAAVDAALAAYARVHAVDTEVLDALRVAHRLRRRARGAHR